MSGVFLFVCFWVFLGRCCCFCFFVAGGFLGGGFLSCFPWQHHSVSVKHGLVFFFFSNQLHKHDLKATALGKIYSKKKKKNKRQQQQQNHCVHVCGIIKNEPYSFICSPMKPLRQLSWGSTVCGKSIPASQKTRPAEAPGRYSVTTSFKMQVEPCHDCHYL